MQHVMVWGSVATFPRHRLWHRYRVAVARYLALMARAAYQYSASTFTWPLFDFESARAHRRSGIIDASGEHVLLRPSSSLPTGNITRQHVSLPVTGSNQDDGGIRLVDRRSPVRTEPPLGPHCHRNRGRTGNCPPPVLPSSSPDDLESNSNSQSYLGPWNPAFARSWASEALATLGMASVGEKRKMTGQIGRSSGK